MAKIKMEDINLKPSSERLREESSKDREKRDPIVNKDAIAKKKKTLGKKLMKKLFNADDISDMRDYILTEVVLPGIGQFGLNALSVIFFNEPLDTDFFPGKKKKKKAYDRASYSSYYEKKKRSKERSRRREEEEEEVDYQEIVLLHREDAEKIVDEMHDRIDEEGSVSIAELYDMIDVAGEISDNDYGWTKKGSIGIKKVSGGWLIDVAEARRL